MRLGDFADDDAVIAELVEADHFAFDRRRRVADDWRAIGARSRTRSRRICRPSVRRDERTRPRFLSALPASTESANFFESFTIACEPESFLIPTTTSGGLKLACVTQLTVAAVAVPPCAAPSTNSPYGIINSACFFAFSSIVAKLLVEKITAPQLSGARVILTQRLHRWRCKVKDSEDQRPARSRALCRRRAMGRRPRQHFSAGESAPRMSVRCMQRQRERRGAAREPADAPVVAARRSGGVHRMGRRPRDDLHDAAAQKSLPMRLLRGGARAPDHRRLASKPLARRPIAPCWMRAAAPDAC